MPSWFVKALFWIAAIFVLALVAIWGLSYLQVKQNSPSVPVGPVPTINTTALAEYTPTPGPSSAQGGTAVYIARPTPYVEWIPADAQVYINALRGATITSATNLTIGSQISAPGAGWVCTQITSDVLGLYTIEGDTFCRISLTWAEWQMIFDPEDITIAVSEGSHVQTLSADGLRYEERALAVVTITVNHIGLNSPGVRFDQRFDFYKDLNNTWSLIVDLKSVFFGVDLRNQANELTADAPDLALADSFAPLMPDGSRSSIISDQLYQAFVDSLTTAGEHHVYNTFFDLATLIAGYQCPVYATPQPGEVCVDHDFAGLESLTVIIPAQPSTPCGYVYAEDMTTKVLPEAYCFYTFIPSGIGSEALSVMAYQIDRDSLDSGVDYETLIQELFSIP